MLPEHKQTINDVLIEEYWWAGKYVVYVDRRASDKTFAQACKDAEELESRAEKHATKTGDD